MQALLEYPLTPSEIIFLGAKSSRGPFSSLVNKIILGVRLNSLVTRMLLAAFIANEEFGAISLEGHRRKYFLGLFSNWELLVVPNRGTIEWPSHSFEAYVARNADLPSQMNRVSDIVYEWMSEDSEKPWEGAFRRIGRRVGRGATEEDVSKAPYSLVEGMLANFEKTHRKSWDRLWWATYDGVHRRQILVLDD